MYKIISWQSSNLASFLQSVCTLLHAFLKKQLMSRTIDAENYLYSFGFKMSINFAKIKMKTCHKTCFQIYILLTPSDLCIFYHFLWSFLLMNRLCNINCSKNVLLQNDLYSLRFIHPKWHIKIHIFKKHCFGLQKTAKQV